MGGEARVPRLCIVVPCYNEDEVLPRTSQLLIGKLASLVLDGLATSNSSVLLVDDGSTDETWQLIERLVASNACCEGIKLSRNQGHQKALLAGLMASKAHYDVTISIDCDGQDDVNAMDDMLRAYIDGAEVVYGVRSNRETDALFKRYTAESFYKFMQLMGVETVFNHADYRLLSKRALDALSDFNESNLYLRGIIPLLGFSSATICYKRKERIAGESHYPLAKMISLALDGVTSLSIKPIRMISWVGFILFVISFIMLIWAIVMHVIGNTTPGWTSLLSVVLLLGGLQLLALGIIGEYIGRIYLECKNRPRYIIEKSTLMNNR